MSPPSAGFSILITSAPRSARNMEPNGPAPYCSTAITVTPSSGNGCVCAASGRGTPWVDPSMTVSSDPIAFDEPFGNQQSLYLVRALADHKQGCVAIQAFDYELLAVAIAAKDAHGF